MKRRQYNELVRLTKQNVRMAEARRVPQYVEWVDNAPRTRNGRRLHRRGWQKMLRLAKRCSVRLASVSYTVEISAGEPGGGWLREAIEAGQRMAQGDAADALHGCDGNGPPRYVGEGGPNPTRPWPDIQA